MLCIFVLTRLVIRSTRAKACNEWETVCSKMQKKKNYTEQIISHQIFRELFHTRFWGIYTFLVTFAICIYEI